MKFSCPHCGQHLDADESARGAMIPCPACKRTIQIPVKQAESATGKDHARKLLHEFIPLWKDRVDYGRLCLVAVVAMIIFEAALELTAGSFSLVALPSSSMSKRVLLFWVVSVVCWAAALGFYARYKGHDGLHLLWALLPCPGVLSPIGMLVLALLKDRTGQKLEAIVAELDETGESLEPYLTSEPAVARAIARIRRRAKTHMATRGGGKHPSELLQEYLDLKATRAQWGRRCVWAVFGLGAFFGSCFVFKKAFLDSTGLFEPNSSSWSLLWGITVLFIHYSLWAVLLSGYASFKGRSPKHGLWAAMLFPGVFVVLFLKDRTRERMDAILSQLDAQGEPLDDDSADETAMAQWTGIAVKGFMVMLVAGLAFLFRSVVLPSQEETPSLARESRSSSTPAANRSRASGSVTGGVGQPGTSEPTLRLPEDFAFLALTRLDQPTNLVEVLRGASAFGVEFGTNSVRLTAGRDAVTGLRDQGLRTGNYLLVNEGKMRTSIDWSPEPFACYRDKSLLGIWLPTEKRFRPAIPGEAPLIWFERPVPPATQSPARPPAPSPEVPVRLPQMELVTWSAASSLPANGRAPRIDLKPSEIGSNMVFLVVVFRLKQGALNFQPSSTQSRFGSPAQSGQWPGVVAARDFRMFALGQVVGAGRGIWDQGASQWADALAVFSAGQPSTAQVRVYFVVRRDLLADSCLSVKCRDSVEINIDPRTRP